MSVRGGSGRGVQQRYRGLKVVETQLQRSAIDHNGCVARAARQVGKLAAQVLEVVRHELEDELVASHELTRHGDARGGLDLVACKHPDLDASMAQGLERRLHTIL